MDGVRCEILLTIDVAGSIDPGDYIFISFLKSVVVVFWVWIGDMPGVVFGVVGGGCRCRLGCISRR